MIDKSADVLMRRFEFAKSQWEQYKPRLEEAYRFTQPYRNKFDSQTEGTRKGFEVYDTTAMEATEAMVSKLTKLLTPFNKRFMYLKASAELEEETRKKLDDGLKYINDIIWKYIDQSRGIMAMTETYYDLVCGTGCLQINQGSITNPLIFSSHPLSSICLERSIVNTIQNVWRAWDIPCADIPILWPDAKLPDTLKRKIKDSQGNERVLLADGTLLNYDSENTKASYYYAVLYEGQKIYEADLESSPWTVYRWTVPPMESYGVGVAQKAMPTIKMLNKFYMQRSMQGDLSLTPPLLYKTDSGFNVYNTRIGPGAQIPITGIGIHDAVKPLDFGANFAVTDESIADLRTQVNKMFYNDPLGSMEDPVRTATEMTMRNQQNAENMSGAFGRIAVEFLTSMFKRILYILSNLGLIPKIDIDGQIIDLYFEIPLMQAQGLESVGKLIQAKEAISAIAGPRVAQMSIEGAQIPLWVAEQIGADTRMVKSSKEIQASIQKILKTIQGG